MNYKSLNYMTAVIVEDETAAVSSLKALLAQNSIFPIQIIAELESISESVTFFRSHPHPDIIFLDIHLADGSAFKIFEEVEIAAPVIITTAYDEYALQAFQICSIDYLMKPVTLASLEKALNKLLMFSPEERLAHIRRTNNSLQDRNIINNLLKTLAHVDNALNKEPVNQPLFVKDGSKSVRINTDDILYLEAFGDYVKVHQTSGKTLLSQVSLKRFEEILSEERFCRVHRSYIVALSHIKYIERKRIRIGEALIPISDSHLSNLMKRISNL